MTLRVKQDSESRGTDWWTWSIWLEGDKKELADVEQVIYTLHSTFPDPVRAVTNRRTGFKLEATGWGEFEIYLKIVLKNGKTRARKHWLTLSDQRQVPSKPGAMEQSSSKSASAGEAPAQAPERPLVAFISSSAADSSLAREVSTLLQTRGFTVVSASHGKAGIPWEVALDVKLRTADVAVFLLSGRPSLWTYNEIEHALAQEIPHIVPVVIGTDVEIPPRLEQFAAIHVDTSTDASNVAKRVISAAEEGGWLREE